MRYIGATVGAAVVLAAAVAVTVGAGTAVAKTCVRSTVSPPLPRVGRTATITVTAWALRREPRALHMVRRAPGGRTERFTARRLSSRRYVARLVFPRAGEWRIWWAGSPSAAGSPCSGALRVVVTA